ncbi:MAG: YggS family pyridoxal phosphate-dependent enzyme [Lachnospiraceae bacterium]|jgi:pyridoxal phosphate enzyme (YggS family)|nr:YggS family pyridoxal phosphate-dependent enzyme [Lachnospiraceae bacterium]
MISENIETVKNKILLACEKSGRNPNEVTLIPVSKTKPVSILLEAYKSGVRLFGENRVQELCDKYSQLPADIDWHLIGHLQRNKVKYIIGKTKLIHSLDSGDLAITIDRESKKANLITDVLVEVNVAGEESKFGLSPDETLDFVKKTSKLSHLRIKGLMTIAPFVADPEENRPVFRRLRKLSVDIARENLDNVSMYILSMGMSNDFEVAVEEGATFVRVGTAIFGAR